MYNDPKAGISYLQMFFPDKKCNVIKLIKADSNDLY